MAGYMHDNDRVVVVIEHVEMKQLEGQWRDCGRSSRFTARRHHPST